MNKKLLLLIALLVYNFPLFSVKAQTIDQCNFVLNKVVEESYKYGTSVNVYTSNKVNENHIGNPTERSVSVEFIFGNIIDSNDIYLISMNNHNPKNNYIAENILNSSQLKNNWANSLVRDCNNVAEVSYGLAHTDWIIEYAIQVDGTTKERECLDYVSQAIGIYLPWNYQSCL